MDGPLFEYETARARVDAEVARLSERAADALACHRGCASCCADDLTVLPVEAAALQAHLDAAGPLAARTRGACAFLDEQGACRVYAVRPFVCRTHGLPIRTRRAALPVLDEISSCALNFRARTPRLEETLDGERVQLLLTTVDARFRARMGISPAAPRVALRSLASAPVSPRPSL